MLWPWIVWAAVTLRDGVGADDLIWLAGLIAAVSTILGFLQLVLVRPLRRWMRTWDEFSESWHGAPARPGFDAIPGVPERIQRIEGEVRRNGGQSLKDRVFAIDQKLDRLAEAKDREHAAIRADLAQLHRTVESKEC